MIRQIVRIKGKRYVIVPEAEFRRLERKAAHLDAEQGPPMPSPNSSGNFPATEFLRASIARDIVRERKALGLSQESLAKLAGIRQETLSRIESGKHSPTVRTVDKIEAGLRKAAGKKHAKRP